MQVRDTHARLRGSDPPSRTLMVREFGTVLPTLYLLNGDAQGIGQAVATHRLPP